LLEGAIYNKGFRHNLARLLMYGNLRRPFLPGDLKTGLCNAFRNVKSDYVVSRRAPSFPWMKLITSPVKPPTGLSLSAPFSITLSRFSLCCRMLHAVSLRFP